MAENPKQTYENHPQPVNHLIVLIGVLVLVLIVSGFGVYKLNAAGELDLGILLLLNNLLIVIAIALTAVRSRFYSLCVQDRVIRLEMNVRLDKLLTGEARERAKDLELGQLIALRFASDEELPDLVDKVLGDKITDRATIKKMIKNWQADFQRV
jgi:hypothetical protein